VNPFSLTRAVKEADRDKKEFRVPDKKFNRGLGISPELDLSINSSISSSKIF
jgi:hypothetical protein